MRNILLIGQLTDISGYGNAARSYFLSLLELEKQGLINLKILNYPCENKVRELSTGEQNGTEINAEVFNLIQEKNILPRLYVSNISQKKQISSSIKMKKECCEFISEGYDVVYFLLNNWLYNATLPSLWPIEGPMQKMAKFSYNKNYESEHMLIQAGNKLIPNSWLFTQQADKIYPCFVWETDRCPDYFVYAWNNVENVKKIISACEWNKKSVIEDERTSLKSDVVPYTINNNQEHCKKTLDKLKTIVEQTDFTFCSVSQWSHRKGFDILLKAFFMEFYNDDVTLILKTYIDVDPNINKTQNQAFQNIISDIKNNIHHNGKNIDFKCKVAIISSFMNKKEINSIYKASNAYVTTSRGEGFGLPIAEFLQFEGPVIVPDKGGHLDFCHPNGFFIKSSYEPCEHMPRMPGLYSAEQNYIECSLRSTREKMRECYEMYKNNPKKFAELSQTSYNHFVNYLSTENCANLMKKAIDIEE